MSMKAKTLLLDAASHLGKMNGRPNAATRWYASTHGSEYEDAEWCDMFVSWVGMRCEASGIIGQFALCKAHADWFKKRGLFDHKPKKGSLVFYDWDRDGWPDHIGFVETVHADGSIDAIEGNTSDACKRKRRYPSNFFGFGHPTYDDPDPDPVVVPPKVEKFVETLRFGDRGPYVEKVQARLEFKGYPLKKWGVDGDFGDETRSAVKKFQKEHKLKVDGIVGPKTWKALFA